MPGDCFVVCDAGGGTVDLVSYRVQSCDPFVMEVVGRVTGAKCGATQVDRAFFRWLETVIESRQIYSGDLGTGGHYTIMPAGRAMFRQFEAIKFTFDGTTDGSITLPRRVQLRNTDEARDRVRQGILKITTGDLTEMFKEPVGQTLKLVTGQVLQVKARGDNVTNIFMSGGFAANPHLMNKVKAFARMHSVEVESGPDCWGAVAKGAVLKGMGLGAHAPRPVQTCPRHYGISVNEMYAAYKDHGDAETFRDPLSGCDMARGQMIWLIRKGDLILRDSPTVSGYDVYCTFTSEHAYKQGVLRVVFVATSADPAPRRLSRIDRGSNEVIDLEVPTRDIPKLARTKQKHNSSRYYRVNMTVKIEVSERVKVTLTCDGTRMAGCETSL